MAQLQLQEQPVLVITDGPAYFNIGERPDLAFEGKDDDCGQPTITAKGQLVEDERGIRFTFACNLLWHSAPARSCGEWWPIPGGNRGEGWINQPEYWIP